MSRDAKRQQKAAQKRKKREQQVQKTRARQRAAEQGSGVSVQINKASEHPITECLVSKGWEKRGLAHVLLTRQLPEGTLMVGGFYVDTLCLGLKDCAALPGVAAEEYESNIKPSIFNDDVEFKKCDPALARAIVEGAVAFADQFGFKPPKRWKEAQHIFDGVGEVKKKPTFGQEGKPCFVHRGETNAQSIIARLERKAGEGNYLVDTGADE